MITALVMKHIPFFTFLLFETLLLINNSAFSAITCHEQISGLLSNASRDPISFQEIPMKKGWRKLLEKEFQQNYMKNLNSFIKSEISKGKIIHPELTDIFSFLNSVPFDKVKVVIIGQDPYHGIGEAHGMSFSVKPGVPIPASLRNVFIEIEDDLGIAPPSHGYLKYWSDQGVLLLNSILTVETGKAASHKNKGWEEFTDVIIKLLNDEHENLVFLLWGRKAQRKGSIVDRKTHLVLESAHPSPRSARNFFGHYHFSKTNLYLKKHEIEQIEWNLPDRDFSR